MTKNLLLLLLLILLITHGGFAQTPVKPFDKCGSDFNVNDVLSDPKRAKKFIQNEQKIKQYIAAMRISKEAGITTSTEITIPVVFHIVAPNPNVVTDAMIMQQLAVLNRDYSGTNADSTNAGAFMNRRGHSKIKFELAKRSPRGCDTIGITRTAKDGLVTLTTVSTIKYASGNGIDAWESYNCKYLNIWIGTFTDGTLGLGTFPDNGTPELEQGVVIDKKTLTFTYPGDYIYGRTLVHEVGHYFNLIHIWGNDQTKPDRCSGTDLVDDTPNQQIATYGKPFIPLFDSCSPAGTTDGINYQNYMDYCDDSVLTMFTNGQVERMIATINTFPSRSALIDKNNKALVPMEGNEVFNMCNTANFTTNVFTSINVGKGGVVWAGTSNAGLYQYRSGQWTMMNSYINNNYQDIKPDKYGGIWVAQSGYSGAQANTGGVLYFGDTTFPATNNFYSYSSGLPSRYLKGLFVDTSQTYLPGVDTPLVYTANFAHITAGNTSAGGVGKGFFPVSPNYFSTNRKGIQQARITDGTASIYCIGGNSKVIWAHIQGNYGRSQILRYKNDVLNDTLPSLDTTNVFNGKLAANFNAKAIYFDAKGNRWVTVNGAGIMVTDSTETTWNLINSADIFPGGVVTFNNNAICGDSAGNVFIGTQNGLIAYRANRPLNNAKAYTLYNTTQGLPSNNIKAIAVDTARQKLLIATDNGIAFWNPVCPGSSSPSGDTFSTVATGDWNNPAIWCNGVVPPANAKIIVRHPVTITSDTHCKSIQLVLPGSFTVATGVNLFVGN